jgi:hypothetical protein
MRIKVILTLVFTGILLTTSGQQKDIWKNWNWLMGEWTGEGSGQPGQGGGTFTFSPDLNKNILVRRSHSEYPAAENRPKVIHDDLMIIYPDQTGIPAKAIYFDNEGHTIEYSIVYAGGSIVLTSQKTTGVPIFRLTYTLPDKDTVNTKFEMSQDGINFMVYVEGNSKRQNRKL